MINKIISFSIRNKFIVGLLTLALIGAGLYAMFTVNLGSVPDITNNQIQVMTVSQNLATEDIEQFITYPVELAMGNLPGVTEIRSISRFGLSVVTIVFRDDMGIYKPRQLVQEKLNEVSNEIPDQFGSPAMGPITTGLGEIYQYTLQPRPGYDSLYTTTELRTIQDWLIRRQLTLVDGVVDVNAFGGKVKQYEVSIDPERLNTQGISISEVFRALQRNNVNTGGAYIEKNQMANFIRGEGLIRSLDDIRKIVIKNKHGIPVTVDDVAGSVHYGNRLRYGAFTQDGHEAVGGMVLMLKGSNPNSVIRKVQDRMKIVQKSLPEGLEIRPFLDRSSLISRTTGTVTRNLTEGALIVVFVLVVLLGNIRGGIIAASVIPLSLLFAFILMRITGVWANLMSLGAIDFGIIVDGSVIIVEGTVHEIEKRIKAGKLTFDQSRMNDLTYSASSSVMNSAFFGQLIILIVFAPILFLTGVEGKMFQPMAYTFGFAVLGAIILCLTYVPMVTALLMKPVRNPKSIWARAEQALQRFSDKIISGLNRWYRPLIRGALKYRTLVLTIAFLFFAGAAVLFLRMGGEFIPKLDEGDIAMQALVRPGSGLSQTVEVSKKIETTLLGKFPEIQTVVARIGVADIPTDPMPMDIADIFIVLEKERDNWTSANNTGELIARIREVLNETLTGVTLVFSQPVELRFNELLTGIREDVAVKLYGDDLAVLAEKAAQMAEIIRSIPGVGDVNAERISGLPQMTVRYDRSKLAQYGLDIQKLNEYISTAFAGSVAGVIFEGEKRFDLVVRFDREHRRSIGDLQNLYIDLPQGAQIPIKEVADIRYVPGPMQISRDNTFRRTFVGVNTRGRDVESVVKDIRQKLDMELRLPPGYYITYGGEFENLQRAKSRLQVVVPVALFLILILLYFALNSLSQAMMIYMAIPLGAIGGVFFLGLRGMPFSISAGVGFIVLFGVAVLNGLVLISRFNSLKLEGITDLKERILTGTSERLRPILLTATAAVMGFMPMAISTSAGAEVQRPLATVVIGGLLSATLLTLVVLPVMYSLMEERKSGAQKSGRIRLILLLALGGLSVFPSTVRAQQPTDSIPVITLEQARQKAVENYPVIRSARLEIEKQQVLKKTAWGIGNTKLFTGKEETGHGQEGIYNRLGIQQEIDVLGISSRIDLQKERVALAERSLDLTTIELERKVSQSWVEVFRTKKILHIYERLDSVFREVARAANIRLETEAISRLEYLATSNQARQVELRKEQAFRDYMSAVRRMNRWFTGDSVYTVPDTLMSALYTPPDLKEESLPDHPLLKLSRQEIAVAEAVIRQRRSQFLPKFQGQYGWQEIDGKAGYTQYQLGITIPLFFGDELGKLQSARIGREIAGQQLIEETLGLHSAYLDVRERYLKWKNSWLYYKDEALPLARDQRAGAILAYREGAIDYITFLQNVRDAIGIEVDAWNTFGRYLESRCQLEFYINPSTSFK